MSAILASGCCIVAKPSEITSATTLLLAGIMSKAGLPDGVFNVVTGSGSTIGQKLAEHMDVDTLSFTGPTRVGRWVVAASGAGDFKKLGLELGGKNPQIVFVDADPKDAADGVALGMAFNSGQCCVSGSRLWVEGSVADRFAQMVADKLGKLRMGDPLDDTTQAGAITTDAQHRTILSYIAQGQAEGATMICGGAALTSRAVSTSHQPFSPMSHPI